MKEAMEKAIHDLGFTVETLRVAIEKANNVEFIVVLEMVKEARDLKTKAEAFLNAYLCDHPDQTR